MKNKILYIINPISGKGKYDYVYKTIDFYSKLYKLDFEIWKWEPADALDPLLTEIVKEQKYDTIVAVGGDGTVHHIAKHLVNSDINLGIIPVGSGDGIARHFHIPHKIPEAVRIIKKSKIVRIDTATANDRFFFGFLGSGFDAVVAHLFAKRKKRGFIRYAQLTLQNYFRANKQKCTVHIDGKIHKTFPYLLTIANTSQYGNGALIAPRASAIDGKLDIIFITKKNIFLFPEIFFRLFNGILPAAPYYKWYKGKEIKVEFDRPNVKIQLDGEPAFSDQELVVKVIPESLNLIVPSKAIWI